MLHKINDGDTLITLPEVIIRLKRVEEWNLLAKKLMNNELLQSEFVTPEITDKKGDTDNNTSDTDSTEIYDIHENIIGTISFIDTKENIKNAPTACHKLRKTKSKAQ